MVIWLASILIIISSVNFIDAKVTNNEVTYAVSTKNNPKLQDFTTPIDSKKINTENPVILIIHGWTNYGDKPWVQNLTNALLKRNDCTVISVDWRKPANDSYPVSAKNAKTVGEIVGNAIVSLVENKIPLSNFHLIGHSLGAHVAGFAGQKVKSKLGTQIPWITGLDPAGPLYELPIKVPKNERLSNDDGKIVEVVHTDGGLLGFHSAIGTTDFFPNGGEFIQPNCSSSSAKNIEKLENYVYCSHEKSAQYYTIAVQNNGIQATKCSSWESYKDKACDGNEHETLGGSNPPTHEGKFYFRIKSPVLNVV